MEKEDNIEVLGDDFLVDNSVINDQQETKKPNGSKQVNDKKPKKHLTFEIRVLFLLAAIFVTLGLGIMFLGNAFNKKTRDSNSFSEESKTIYNVCLSQNNYYKDSCIGEGKEYLSLITNEVPLEFKYTRNFSKETKYNIKYYTIGELKIYDRDNTSKILLEENKIIGDNENIKGSGKSLEFNTKLNIPFKKHNDYVNGYKSRYSLNSLAEYKVVLYIDEGKGAKEVASLKIPLGSQTFSIEKNNIKNDNVSLTGTIKRGTNKILLSLSFIFMFIFVVLMGKLLSMIIKVVNQNTSTYDKELKKILTEYDRVIVMCKNDYQYDKSKIVFEVENFNELLDARDALEKPIIYEKVNSIKSNFYVDDNDKIYKYTLKESNFDK